MKRMTKILLVSILAIMVMAVWSSATYAQGGQVKTPDQPGVSPQQKEKTDQIKKTQIKKLPDLVPVPGPPGNFCEIVSNLLRVYVKNQGTTPAGPTYTRVRFLGARNPSTGNLINMADVIIPTKGLAVGETVALPPIEIPTECYAPDCHFTIFVNVSRPPSTAVIQELDYNNNVVNCTCPK